MSSKKINLALALATIVIVFATGCYKDVVVPATGTGGSNSSTPDTKTYSFASDIIPLFSKNCAISGCHASGGKKPDLSDANAYNSLTNGNYYSTSSPETSEIYMWLTGKRGTQMPPNGADASINKAVLGWIKQGAKNN